MKNTSLYILHSSIISYDVIENPIGIYTSYREAKRIKDKWEAFSKENEKDGPKRVPQLWFKIVKLDIDSEEHILEAIIDIRDNERREFVKGRVLEFEREYKLNQLIKN